MSAIGIIAIIFTFGVAILAHEFGHFVCAKLLGVGVETFSIGMGKKLVKKKWGETTYCISAIPFGGYVVLKGAMSKEMEKHLKEQEGEKESEPVEQTEITQKATGKKSLPSLVSEDILLLRNKPLPVKIAIYGAGVFFNYIIAIMTFTGIGVVGMYVPAPKPPVVGYVSGGSVPQKLGIKKGDVVTAVNGQPVKEFDDIYDRIGRLLKANVTTLTLALHRGGTDYVVQVPLAKDSPTFRGFIENFGPPLPPYIDEVVYNLPAEKAGIKAGDLIMAINGKEIEDWRQLVNITKRSVGKPLRIRIRRNGEYLTKVVTPIPRPKAPKTGQMGIALGAPHKILKRLPPGEAFMESLKASYRVAEFVVISTYKMFARFNVREISENVGGPVAIAIASYRYARRSLREYFYFFGAFNIMLLILNILPLPILDGGHILFSVYEAVFRRSISAKVLIRIYSVMIALLITLALLVTYNDIIRNLWRLGLGR